MGLLLPFLFVPFTICYRCGMNWTDPAILALVTLALREDHASDDVTTQTLVGKDWKARGQIRAKENGVVAGLPLAKIFFRALDPMMHFRFDVPDGQPVRKGQSMATFKGNARAILAAERPALNAIQHLSGIASYTKAQVSRLQSRKTKLLDTRKTLPGWRLLEKYAVRCGGGANHRVSLADAVLVKDNHLWMSRVATSDWKSKLKALKKRRPSLPLQVEIQTPADLKEALLLKPDMVLLDNLPLKALKPMIQELRKVLPKTQIEISGGVRPEDIGPLSRLRVERISMGRLTHSAPSFDCSLDILNVDPR